MRAIGIVLLPLVFSIVSAPAIRPDLKIECVAGCGGSVDGTAIGAKLMEPFGVAFDKQGNWYICEYKGQRITKVDPKGSVSLFAGNGSISTEPPGTPAGQLKFNDPHGLVITKARKMYIDGN